MVYPTLMVLMIQTNDIVYVKNVKVREIGAIAEYMPERSGKFSWLDNSPKRLHGEVTGAKLLVDNDRMTEFKASVTGDTSLTDIVQPGYRIESILIEETAGMAVTGGVDIGTTASGSEVVNAETVNANAVVLASLSSTFFSASAPLTLYISAATAWNSASINITIVIEKVI